MWYMWSRQCGVWLKSLHYHDNRMISHAHRFRVSPKIIIRVPYCYQFYALCHNILCIHTLEIIFAHTGCIIWRNIHLSFKSSYRHIENVYICTHSYLYEIILKLIFTLTTLLGRSETFQMKITNR